MKALKIIGFVLSGVQLCISLALIYFVMASKMVPVSYGAVGALILILLSVIVFLFAKMKSKAIKIIGIVLSVLICATMILGIVYLRSTNKALDEVTGNTTQVDEINVYVASDDTVESTNEAAEKNYVFGYTSLDDADHIQETVDEIEATAGKKIIIQEFESIYYLADAFNEGSVNALITGKGTLGILETDEDEAYATFASKLKVIMEKTIVEEIVVEEKDVDLDHFCVYFSGIDTFGSVNTKSRSDVNIIGVVNNKTKQVLLVSTPRDYFVELANPAGKMDKLTHAGLYGIDSSMGTLGKLYDTDLSYYVRINFSGFQKIIDKLGGIDVDSEFSFTSITQEGTYKFAKGKNHLNGPEALGFARARYAFKDGDRQRGKNQMQVIKATIEKLESAETLKNYGGLMDEMSSFFQTDMTKEDVGYLVQSTLSDGGWEVITYSVSGSDSSSVCYSLGTSAYVMVPNKDDVAYGSEIIKKVLSGEKITQDEVNNYIENKGNKDVITEEIPTETTEEKKED